MVRGQLADLGFVFPELDPMIDPLAYMHVTGEYLGKVEPWLVTPLTMDGQTQ